MIHHFHFCSSISQLGPWVTGLFYELNRGAGGEREREREKERKRERENFQHRAKPDCQVLFWGLFQITVTYRLRLELSLKLGLQTRSQNERCKSPAWVLVLGINSP